MKVIGGDEESKAVSRDFFCILISDYNFLVEGVEISSCHLGASFSTFSSFKEFAVCVQESDSYRRDNV
jgi:hypothetical protein